MDKNIKYLFTACVALDDSITEAQKQIPTNIICTEEVGVVHTKASNATIENATMNEPKGVGTTVELRGDAFDIEPVNSQTSKAQTISDENKGQNFGIWQWWVNP